MRTIRKILPLLAASLLGCSTFQLTPERIDALANIAGAAAQIYAANYIAKHPENKPRIDAIIDSLTTLINNREPGDGREDAFARVLAALRTDTFRGEAGDLYISGPKGTNSQARHLVIFDNNLNKPVAVKGPILEPTMRKVVIGLKRGARVTKAPPTLPEKPVVKKKVRVIQGGGEKEVFIKP